MTTRRGPGNAAPGHIDDTGTVPTQRDIEVTRWHLWDAHDRWWEDPTNRRRIEVACDADNATHAESKRARAYPDRVKHVADQLLRDTNPATLVAFPSTKRIAGRTLQSRDMVKVGLRVLIAAGVVVNVTEALRPKGHARGQAPKRALTYVIDLISDPTNSPTDMVGSVPRDGAACPTPNELLPRENSAGTSSDNVTRLPTGSPWVTTLVGHIERRIAEAQRRTVTGIRTQYGTRVRQLAAEAADRWEHRSAPATDDRLVGYYADKVVIGNGNPSTWQSLDAQYPEAEP